MAVIRSRDSGVAPTSEVVFTVVPPMAADSMVDLPLVEDSMAARLFMAEASTAEAEAFMAGAASTVVGIADC